MSDEKKKEPEKTTREQFSEWFNVIAEPKNLFPEENEAPEDDD